MDGGSELARVDRPDLYLLPRTLFAKPDAVVASAASSSEELDSIQVFLKSSTLSSSSKLIEEAKAICNSTGDPLKLHHEDVDIAAVENTRELPQRRRPALHRKRAHFSFNPNVSGSLANMELETSVDCFKDPDELFLEFEKTERAKKELKKQRGEGASDSSPNAQWATTAKRRPGLLGRKASYRHHCPEHIYSADALVLSQGEIQTFSPSKAINGANFCTNSQPMSKPGMSPEIERKKTDLFDTSYREGFIDDKERGVDNLLDTLLHCFEDVNEGAEIDFLQETLQIRSTNVDEICFSPLEGVQLNDATTMVSKVTLKKLDGSQQIRVSPNATGSPLAAISILRTRISQIDPLKDPFSSPSSSEKSMPENSLPGESSSKSATSDPLSAIAALRRHISEADSLKDQIAMCSSNENSSSKNSLPGEGSSKTAFSLPIYSDHPDMVATEDVNASGPDHLAKVDDTLLGVSIAKEAGHGIGELPSGTLDCSNAGTSSGLFDNGGSRNCTIANDINTDSFGIDGIVDYKVNDVQEVRASDHSSINAATDTPVCGSSGNSSFLPDWISEVNDGQEAAVSCGEDQSSINASLDIPVGGCSRNPGVLPEPNDEANQTDLTASRNRPVEQKAPRKRQNKSRILRRQSLAGAGMAWESGLRRSTRIRMKPLEYWRGERLLYARIHNSLPTVIGLKYSSPAKTGEKPVLKVKSYVPQQYADLVQKLALH